MIGYKTENCDDDPNWCFRSAVGVTLPPTFYSYPSSVVQSYNESLLAFGDAPLTGINTQLLSIGDGLVSTLPQAQISELEDMLASTEYDEIPMDTPMETPLDGPDLTLKMADGRPQPSMPQDIGPLSQAAIELSTAPQVARLDRDHPTKRRHFAQSRTFLYLESRRRSHRFTASRSRRALRSNRAIRKVKTVSAGDRPAQLVRRDDASGRGHDDGMKAAKAFAAFDGSRLGFSGQFMQDALTAMNGAVTQEDEQSYKDAFSTFGYIADWAGADVAPVQGLADGELEVIRSLAQGQNS